MAGMELGSKPKGEDMIKFSCTRADVGEIHYATVVAETEQEAKDMSVAESNKRRRGSGGRARHWTASVLESDVPGPARVLDSGYRDA